MSGKINVVLLDDNKATNYIHTRYLEKNESVGQVHSFQVGVFALQHLKEAKKLPDLIFVDINMPTMDAWEFLEEIRKLEFDFQPKMFLLTTTVSPSDLDKMLNYPELVEILYKPLGPETIKAVFDKYFVEIKEK